MAAKQIVEFVTPVGRLVGGSPFEARTEDFDGAKLVDKEGKPYVEYTISVAIAKSDPKFPAFWQILSTEARRGWPQQFDANGQCINPGFAWKMTDGDSQLPNKKGNKPCDREGYPGHYVFHFTTRLAPKCYHVGKETAGMEITDPNAIKRGYYVDVYGTVAANDSSAKGAMNPGIYLNPRFVRLVHLGEEIISGPDAKSAFANAANPSLPPGAVTVAATVSTPAAAVPGAAAAPAVPGAAIPPPAHDFLKPKVKTMTAKAAGATYEQFMAAGGWTDQMMIDQGYMTLS